MRNNHRKNRQNGPPSASRITRTGTSKEKITAPNSFAEAITSKEWTEPETFEELCLLMLSELLERPFRRASPGFQGGRDLDADLGPIVTLVECKRYTGKLRTRELLGELWQAINSRPNLEVYILCTTTIVDAQLASQMRQQAAPHLIQVLFLDCAKPIPPLATCFAATKAWRTHEHAMWANDPVIADELEKLKAAPGAEDLLVSIFAALSGVDAGVAGVRQQISLELKRVFSSDPESRGAFGQPLAVLTDKLGLRRTRVEEQLAGWLNNWPTTKSTALVLGNEGVGKTWALASWIASNLNRLPPVLFITRVDEIVPNLIKVLVLALRKWAGGPTEDVWERWLTRRLNDRGPASLLTVVFDGLNERPSAHWQELLQQAIARSPKLKVIITSRPRFAESRLEYSPPYALNSESWCMRSQICGINVDGFDDAELDRAFVQAGVGSIDLSAEVRNLIRVPRYFRIALETLPSVKDYNDITLERLLFLDFRNRIDLGRFSLVRSMPDRRWQNALQNLVIEKRDQIYRSAGGFRRVLKEREIQDVLGQESRLNADDIETCLSEITEGLLFKKIDRNRYEAEPRLIQYALGTLLLEEVLEKLESGWDAAEQRLAEFCEPLAGIDFLASIIGTAAAIALLSGSNCPEQAKTLLLASWADTQNADITTMFAAYARTSPATYLEVAELLDDRGALKGQGGDFILDALLRMRDLPEYQQIVLDRFLYWMGWDESLFPSNESAIATHQRLKVDLNLSIPTRKARRSRELRRLTLSVVRQGTRLPWLNTILASCFVAAARRDPADVSDVVWIVRLNPYDPLEVKQASRLVVERLLKIPNPLCREATTLFLATLGGADEEVYIHSHLSDELKRFGFNIAGDLIKSMGARRRKNNLFRWLDPLVSFEQRRAELPASALNFEVLVRSTRENPAVISKIYTLVVSSTLDEYLRPGPGGMTLLPQLTDWTLPSVVIAPFLQATDLERIDQKLKQIADRLNALGLSYTTIGRLEQFVGLLFKLSDGPKRAQLRSDWGHFDLDGIASEENWSQLASKFSLEDERGQASLDGQRNGLARSETADPSDLTLYIDGDWLPESKATEYLSDWVRLSSQTRSALLAVASDPNFRHEGVEVLRQKWSWKDSISKEEQVYGALLSAWDCSFSVDQVTERLPPIFWATAALRRDCLFEELPYWQSAFDDWIMTSDTRTVFDFATSLTLRTLKIRFDRRTSSDVVGHNLELLYRIVQYDKSAARKWAHRLQVTPTKPRGEFVRFFHILLIRALISSDLELAESLWRGLFETNQNRLAPMRNCSELWHGLTSSIPLSRDSWLQSALSHYDNDLSLFELVIHCYGNSDRRDWLSGVIERDKNSPIDWRRARGNTLAGFWAIDQGPSSLGYGETGWSEVSVTEANRWRRKSVFARHWYEGYLREPGTVKAVANLVLYLASVDPRASLWRADVEQHASNNRLQHCKLFAHSVAQFEKENAECLMSQYLGWPLSDEI